MKASVKIASLLLCVFVLLPSFNSEAKVKNLKKKTFTFVYEDKEFADPFVDIDEWRDTPVRHRYVHGGFRSNGTRFSFYFPEEGAYQGRFFQYIDPFPDSENSVMNNPYWGVFIKFALDNGSYFVSTNEGGAIDFSSNQGPMDPTIGAYRANAACAEFSRVIAETIYGKGRAYGYCFGGSGGAYRTVGGVENTRTWDGAVPFVMGSPMAIPTVFSVRLQALRVLGDKLDGIVDAMDAGGSGKPYEGLTNEQIQILQETTRMGFPIKAWSGYPYMDAHGFSVLYPTIVQMDPSYFHEDFWNKPGYAGYEPSKSLSNARVQFTTTIKSLIGQTEGEKLGLVQPVSDADRGSVDTAWKTLGGGKEGKPVAYDLGTDIPEIGFGGDLVILSGKAKGSVLQLSKVSGSAAVLGPTNPIQILAQVEAGDSVRVDNSDFLAVQSYYRHQVPSEDYYVWDQFRDQDGNPVYPQRGYLVAPLISLAASGTAPTGNIKSKVILVCGTYDREAFPWQGDWYRNQVDNYLGTDASNHFRLWYIDRMTHGSIDDPTVIVDGTGALQSALLAVSEWVEKGKEPSPTTNYSINEGQVILSADASERGGVQPIAEATVDGGKKVTVKPGEKVSMHVKVTVPAGQGKVVEASIAEGKKKFSGNYADFMYDFFGRKVDLSGVSHPAEGVIEFDCDLSYDEPGTYFAAVKVVSQDDALAGSDYGKVGNIDRVRIVVES